MQDPIISDFTSSQLYGKIINATGREVLNGILKDKTTIADVSILSNGVYFVKINEFVFRIIKE